MLDAEPRVNRDRQRRQQVNTVINKLFDLLPNAKMNKYQVGNVIIGQLITIEPIVDTDGRSRSSRAVSEAIGRPECVAFTGRSCDDQTIVAVKDSCDHHRRDADDRRRTRRSMVRVNCSTILSHNGVSRSRCHALF